VAEASRWPVTGPRNAFVAPTAVVTRPAPKLTRGGLLAKRRGGAGRGVVTGHKRAKAWFDTNGAYGIRTRDLLNAIEALYQLS
jgi:hypothetical protein